MTDNNNCAEMYAIQDMCEYYGKKISKSIYFYSPSKLINKKVRKQNRELKITSVNYIGNKNQSSK